MSGIINSVGSKSGVIGQTDIVTPHFEAYGDATHTIDGTNDLAKTKLPNEKFDSHGWYNNATDSWYFQPLEAGIYLIGTQATGYAEDGVDNLKKLTCQIMKNADTVESQGFFDGRSNDFYNITVSTQSLVSFNGSSDYVWSRVAAWTAVGDCILINPGTTFWGFKVHNL